MGTDPCSAVEYQTALIDVLQGIFGECWFRILYNAYILRIIDDKQTASMNKTPRRNILR